MSKGFATLIIETLWLVATLFTAIALYYPVFSQVKLLPRYLILIPAFWFIGFTYVRYTVTFKQLLFLKPKVVRWVWFIVNINVFILFLSQLQHLLNIQDSFSLYVYTFEQHNLSIKAEGELLHYIKTLSILGAVLAFVGIIGFNVMLVKSFFKKRRKSRERTIDLMN